MKVLLSIVLCFSAILVYGDSMSNVVIEVVAGSNNILKACIECGRISDRYCSCPLNKAYQPHWCKPIILSTHEITFFVSSNAAYKVDVPYHWEPRVLAHPGDFLPSCVVMPECKVVQNGRVFDKWQQVGDTTNLLFSAGEKVHISSNTVFVATWKSAPDGDAKDFKGEK